MHRDQVRGSCPPGASPPLHAPPPSGQWGSARSHWTPARARCGNTLALRDRKQSVVPGRSTGHAGDLRSTCWIAPLVAVTRGLVRCPLNSLFLYLGFRVCRVIAATSLDTVVHRMDDSRVRTRKDYGIIFNSRIHVGPRFPYWNFLEIFV